VKKIFFHLKKNCGKLWLNAFSRLKIRKRWKMEVGSGRWRLEDGRWKMEVGGWRLGAGCCTSTPLSVTGAGCCTSTPLSVTGAGCWVLEVGGWVLDVG
tara:strand:- start:52574 stop:52867 length:294 start_codon:yes stop_codon:yes gene_type:complete